MKYGIVGSVRLVKNLILTKIFFHNARLIKFPFDIRNKKNIKIGDKFSTGIFCRVEAYPKHISDVIMTIGKNVRINDFVHITAADSVTIGDNVLIASKVLITDVAHGSYIGDEQDSRPDEIVNNRELSTKSVFIGNNVWIGENVNILPGVFIGNNCIIGAGSVVTGYFLANSIIAGNPARVIKKYDFDIKRWVKV